jgi:hypothetical protein
MEDGYTGWSKDGSDIVWTNEGKRPVLDTVEYAYHYQADILMIQIIDNRLYFLLLISHFLPITNSPNDIKLNSSNGIINPIFTLY